VVRRAPVFKVFLIVDGIDGTGKTTFCKDLVSKLGGPEAGWHYYKEQPIPGVSWADARELPDHPMSSMVSKSGDFEGYVFDRCWPSNIVHQYLLEGLPMPAVEEVCPKAGRNAGVVFLRETYVDKPEVTPALCDAWDAFYREFLTTELVGKLVHRDRAMQWCLLERLRVTRDIYQAVSDELNLAVTLAENRGVGLDDDEDDVTGGKVGAFFDLFHKTVEVSMLRAELEASEDDLRATTRIAAKHGITQEQVQDFALMVEGWDDDELEALYRDMRFGKMTIEEFLRTGEHYD
jgi:hypothetical protein